MRNIRFWVESFLLFRHRRGSEFQHFYSLPPGLFFRFQFLWILLNLVCNLVMLITGVIFLIFPIHHSLNIFILNFELLFLLYFILLYAFLRCQLFCNIISNAFHIWVSSLFLGSMYTLSFALSLISPRASSSLWLLNPSLFLSYMANS